MYDNKELNTQNWTNRAGSFLEQSRAFLDSYLGRWDRANENADEEVVDECTSGATSGEDVWGTPTSGENDEIQMFNSDQTNSVNFISTNICKFLDLFIYYFIIFLVSYKIFIIIDG